jgi:hypothetical protein
MSNLEDGLSEDTEPIDPPVDDAADTDLAGGEDLGEEAPPEEAEPEYDYLDIPDPDAKYVRVKVDGEEMSVPLSEALSGYSRTQDYTRKTQEVAAQRQEAEEALRIARALQANPGLTMQVLANQAGVSVEEFLGMSPGQKQQVVEDASYEDEDEYLDPYEKQSRQALSRVEALEQRLAQQEADRELRMATDGLKRQFGATDEDVLEVVEQAIKMNVGLEFLPILYQARRDSRTQAQIQAEQEARRQREQQTQQRRQSAAAASQVVGSGAGASSGGLTSGVDPDKPMSIREAILASMEEPVS